LSWITSTGPFEEARTGLCLAQRSRQVKALELITGDNVQGYANDIHLFGRRKGSGETIWEIKEKLSTVSAEFQMRYQKRIPAYDVVCSGFFDSIGLYQSCTEEQHRTVREWLDLLKMEDMARKRFDHLSHGQQRLILLARAMVKSPLLMILDEPCDGLDYANRRRSWSSSSSSAVGRLQISSM